MSRARPTTTEDIRIFFAKMTCLIGAKEETTSRCLKITEKVSLKLASEASYVYILSGQKLIQKCQIWSVLASI